MENGIIVNFFLIKADCARCLFCKMSDFHNKKVVDHMYLEVIQ